MTLLTKTSEQGPLTSLIQDSPACWEIQPMFTVLFVVALAASFIAGRTSRNA